MKNTPLLFILFACALFISSCTKDNINLQKDTKQSHQKAYEELQARIIRLNSTFSGENKLKSIQPNTDFGNLLQLLDERGLLQVEPEMPFFPENWYCEAQDAAARELGKRLNFTEAANETHAALVSLICEKTKERTGEYPPPVPGQEPPVPEGESEGYAVGTNERKIYNPYLYDPIQPILFDYLRLGERNAFESGIRHNLLIQELYMEDPNNFLKHDISTAALRLSDIVNRIGWYDSAADPHMVEDMAFEILTDLGIPDYGDKADYIIEKYHLGDEARINEIYIRNVSQYSGALALEYSRKFIEAIEQSEVTEEDKENMLSFISVAVNSRLLWNMQLPNPMQTNRFMVYTTEGNWDYMCTEKFLISFMSSQVVLWGIPKYNKRYEIDAIIFYEHYHDYLPFDEYEFETRIKYRNNMQIPLTTLIKNSYTSSQGFPNGEIVIKRGNYEIYQMEGYEGIYVLSFENALPYNWEDNQPGN